MRLKSLVGDLVMIAILAGGGYGVYRYFFEPVQGPKAVVRYKDNDQDSNLYNTDAEPEKLDDCERHLDRDIYEMCLEKLKAKREADN